MKLKANKSQLAFVAEHPEMSRDYQEQEEARKDECQCKEPDFALSKPSLKSDGTYFQFCKQCLKFRNVPAPQPRELVF
jgi:hypothetical protein